MSATTMSPGETGTPPTSIGTSMAATVLRPRKSRAWAPRENKGSAIASSACSSRMKPSITTPAAPRPVGGRRADLAPHGAGERVPGAVEDEHVAGLRGVDERGQRQEVARAAATGSKWAVRTVPAHA